MGAAVAGIGVSAPRPLLVHVAAACHIDGPAEVDRQVPADVDAQTNAVVPGAGDGAPGADRQVAGRQGLIHTAEYHRGRGDKPIGAGNGERRMEGGSCHATVVKCHGLLYRCRVLGKDRAWAPAGRHAVEGPASAAGRERSGERSRAPVEGNAAAAAAQGLPAVACTRPAAISSDDPATGKRADMHQDGSAGAAARLVGGASVCRDGAVHSGGSRHIHRQPSAACAAVELVAVVGAASATRDNRLGDGSIGPPLPVAGACAAVGAAVAGVVVATPRALLIGVAGAGGGELSARLDPQISGDHDEQSGTVIGRASDRGAGAYGEVASLDGGGRAVEDHHRGRCHSQVRRG